MKKKTRPEPSKRSEADSPEPRRDYLEEHFLETKNPLVPIEELVWAHKAGRRPPDWVVRWLAEAFEKYSDSNFNIPIERLLGLSGRGKRHPLRALYLAQRDAGLLSEIFILHSLGVTMETAIEAVASKSKLNWPRGTPAFGQLPQGNIKPVTASYLKKKLYARLKAHPSMAKEWSEIVSRWSTDEKKEHLLRYPLLNSGFKVT